MSTLAPFKYEDSGLSKETPPLFHIALEVPVCSYRTVYFLVGTAGRVEANIRF